VPELPWRQRSGGFGDNGWERLLLLYRSGAVELCRRCKHYWNNYLVAVQRHRLRLLQLHAGTWPVPNFGAVSLKTGHLMTGPWRTPRPCVVSNQTGRGYGDIMGDYDPGHSNGTWSKVGLISMAPARTTFISLAYYAVVGK